MIDAHERAMHETVVRVVDAGTPLGAVLCFPHGMHPLHCPHSSEPISSGMKYIIPPQTSITLPAYDEIIPSFSGTVNSFIIFLIMCNLINS